ncbi:hypothetical protein V5O48_007399 [Marasmius crinis-equi]|uniref:Cytochrome P450 n=1 Tax=Marasmius crinis-equi TaxID=585013 RepID=A0ABR3FGZ1_9AGAR
MFPFDPPATLKLDYPFLVKAASALIVTSFIPNLLERARLYWSTKHIVGPPWAGFIAGNFQESLDDEKAVVINQWMEKYGKVFRTWGMFGETNIYLADLKGLSHVLKHDAVEYQKPDQLVYMMGRLTGCGVFIAEGEQHRKQRRVLNPAFGAAEIRGLTEIFVEKSIELRDAWASQLENDNAVKVEVDVLHWMSQMTLDVIGQAVNKFTSVSVVVYTHAHDVKPESNGDFRRGIATSSRIAKELYERSKSAIEKVGTSQERDLFSLLIKSNMSLEVPEAQRMTEEEQIPSSTSTTLAIYLLCIKPENQSKLRAELLSVPTDSPSMDQLNALPYLDAVVRETLRVLAPVQSTVREAMKDDVIPLGKPYVDRYGREHDVLEVKKGQGIIIPLLAINKDKSLWGEDAEDFKPERWENLPEAVNAIPGVWGNLMTFLGGPHACIGWRFTIVETKALLFTLFRAFEFELAIPQEDILIKRGFAVHRPVVRGKEGNQLPVVIRSVKA